MLGCVYLKQSTRPTLEIGVPFVVEITRNLRDPGPLHPAKAGSG